MSERSIRVCLDVELPSHLVDASDRDVADWVRYKVNDPLVPQLVMNPLGNRPLQPVFGTLKVVRGEREIY